MPDDTMFDVNEFASQQCDVMDTLLEALPENDYPGTIDRFEVRKGEATKGQNVGKPFFALDVWWELDVPEETKQRLGRDKFVARQGFFLDTENGKISNAKGKNVKLGALRDAIGQNAPGWTLNSLPGGRAMCHVKPDILDDGRQFDRVVAVRKAA